MANNSKNIDTSRFFIYNLHHFVKYIFGGQVLPMLILFSGLFIISAISFVFYAFLIVPMIYKFAFDILADTAKGNMTPMVRENYLVSNVVIIKVIFISVLFEAIQFVMRRYGVSEKEIFGFVLISGFILPAIYMSLALTNSLLVSFNPLILYKIINTSFMSYSVFVVFWSILTAAYNWVINPIIYRVFPTFLDGIASSFIKYAILFLAFHIMGYILYQYRKEFDLAHIGFEDNDNHDIEIKPSNENPIYARINKLLKEDEIEQALKIIITQQKEGDNSVTLQNMFKNAMNIKLANPDKMTLAHQVHRNLNNQKTSNALKLVTEHLDTGQHFIPQKPEDINLLIKASIRAQKPKYIAALLKDFENKYPDHQDIVPNYFLYAKSLYEKRENRDKSKQIIMGLIDKYPQHRAIPEIKSWLKGLELMSNKNSLR